MLTVWSQRIKNSSEPDCGRNNVCGMNVLEMEREMSMVMSMLGPGKGVRNRLDDN